MKSGPETSTDTKGFILQQAKALFATQGYRGVSIREIATACGMAKASLYHHFKDKRELYLEVLDADADRLARVLGQAARQGDTCRERITRIAAAYVGLLSEKRHVILLTLREMGGLEQEIRQLIGRRAGEILRPVQEVIEQGMDSGELRPMDSRLATLSLLGMLNIFITYQLLVEDAEIGKDAVEHTVALFMQGAAPR